MFHLNFIFRSNVALEILSFKKQGRFLKALAKLAKFFKVSRCNRYRLYTERRAASENCILDNVHCIVLSF